MHLTFTTKKVGDTDLVDESTGQVRYTIRSSMDGKMKTIRRPAQDPSPNARGPFVARFHFHNVLSNKIELKEGEQVKEKEWMQEVDNGRTFTVGSGNKYIWSSQQHGDSKLLDEDGQQVAYLYDRSSGLFGGEKRARASLEVNNEVEPLWDDIVVSCLYVKLLEQYAGVFGFSHSLAVAIAS